MINVVSSVKLTLTPFGSVTCQILGLSHVKIWIIFYLETPLILTRGPSK